jgi:hypothetical protein
VPCTEPEPISLLHGLAARVTIRPLYKIARRNAPTARLYAAGGTRHTSTLATGSAKHSARPTMGLVGWNLVRGFEVLGVQGMMPMGAMSDLGGGGSARMTVKLVLLMIREGAATSESGEGGDGLSAGDIGPGCQVRCCADGMNMH